MTTEDDVHAALDAFDRAFASGDADLLAERFAVDATAFLLHREPIVGRPAIRERWKGFFAEYDPGAWEAEHQIVEVHGDRAYTVNVYTETLVHRGGGPSRSVWGRLVLFLRLDPDGEWRVTMAMNSHSRPMEDVPAEAT